MSSESSVCHIWLFQPMAMEWSPNVHLLLALSDIIMSEILQGFQSLTLFPKPRCTLSHSAKPQDRGLG
jgi:hypothetical protein